MTVDNKFILAVDIGTTSTRAILFDELANAVFTSQTEYDQIYPHPGWHEQRMEDLISTVNQCLEGVAKKLPELKIEKSQIPAISITNQRETACVWSKTTGKPLFNGENEQRDGGEAAADACSHRLA